MAIDNCLCARAVADALVAERVDDLATIHEKGAGHLSHAAYGHAAVMPLAVGLDAAPDHLRAEDLSETAEHEPERRVQAPSPIAHVP